MSLFDAQTPTPVTLTGTNTGTAPQYLTNYLTQLAQTGQSQLGTTVDGVTTPYTGNQLIAGLPTNLRDLYSGAQSTLDRSQTPMNESLTALRSGAQGVSASDISQFYNPYEQDVVNEMGRQSALNVQQGMMPALKAAFAGQGGYGSQRYASAMGQAMGDVQSDLYGNQAKLRSEGYKSALDAALKDRGYDIQAGQGLTQLGQAESTAATTGLKSLSDIGTQELGYEQSKIEAPLTRASNVAGLLRGYTYPTTQTEVKQQLPSAYPPSALQQISGLGALLGSGFNTESGWGNQLTAALNRLLTQNSTTTSGGGGTTDTSGGGTGDQRTQAEIDASNDLDGFDG
jgi:hypothetical protein